MSENDRPLNDEQVYELPDNVMLRSVGDEVVLLNFDTERYFGLDAMGAEFLSLLSSDQNIGAVVATLLQNFDVAETLLRSDLGSLVTQLCEAGLLAQKADAP